MKCMRCGTAIQSDHVFCETCSEDMKRHPVDPATPVVIPQRPTSAPVKQAYKKVRKPEEIVASLRSIVIFLTMVVLALLVALGITVSLFLQVLDSQEAPAAPEAYSISQLDCFT